MASKIHVELTDDLDGGAAEETVKFGLDGKNYEIDLSAKNALVLREMFGEYTVAARRSGAAPRVVSKPKAATKASVIRDWATANGFKTADRGRIPAEVLKAYQDSIRAA